MLLLFMLCAQNKALHQPMEVWIAGNGNTGMYGHI